MIKKLTPEQEAKIPEYVNQGIKIGLDTSPLNLEKVTEAINLTYTCAGEPAPKEIIIVDSPQELVRLGKKFLGNKFSLYSDLCYGQHDINWVMFYKFFKEECGVEGLDKVEGLYKAALECGWFLPFKDVCYVSKKPTQVHMKSETNSRGEVTYILHNPNGPAVAFADGYELYALNGIPMKKEYIMEELSVQIIMREENVDVRRELLRKFSLENFIRETGGKVLDTLSVELNGKQCTYQLLEIQLGTESDPVTARVLKMDNPSIDAMHVEGVEDNCNTVAEALAWRNGFDTWVEPLALT